MEIEQKPEYKYTQVQLYDFPKMMKLYAGKKRASFRNGAS